MNPRLRLFIPAVGAVLCLYPIAAFGADAPRVDYNADAETPAPLPDSSTWDSTVHWNRVTFQTGDTVVSQ